MKITKVIYSTIFAFTLMALMSSCQKKVTKLQNKEMRESRLVVASNVNVMVGWTPMAMTNAKRLKTTTTPKSVNMVILITRSSQTFMNVPKND
jgi:hypothetical protein